VGLPDDASPTVIAQSVLPAPNASRMNAGRMRCVLSGSSKPMEKSGFAAVFHLAINTRRPTMRPCR
jgi:hypothetical protein